MTKIIYRKVTNKGWDGYRRTENHICSGGLCARGVKVGDDAFFVGELFNMEAGDAMVCSKECLKNLAESWDMSRDDIFDALERGMDA